LDSTKANKKPAPADGAGTGFGKSNAYFGVILMATTGQTLSQAMQKMQESSFEGSAFLAEAGCPGVSNQVNTFSGHASRQAPSAMHKSKSTATQVP
jgi:hypothetical protein